MMQEPESQEPENQEDSIGEVEVAEREVAEPAAPESRPRKKKLKIESEEDLLHCLEAILFVGYEPLHLQSIVQAFPNLTLEDVKAAIEKLSHSYRMQHRPYRIHETNEGYVLELLGHYQKELLKRTRPDRGAKLSREAIEILSVVAYRQPIDQLGIEQIVAVNPRSTLRQLIRRDLIEVAQSEDEEGTLIKNYSTTERFLDLFELESLEDLPVSADLSEI